MSSYFNNDFAERPATFKMAKGIGQPVQRKAFGIDQGANLAVFDEGRQLAEDPAMLLPANARKHGYQHEHDVQRQRLGMHRRQVVGASRSGRNDASLRRGRLQRMVQVGAANRIDDDIEAMSPCQPVDVLLHRFAWIEDRLIRPQFTNKRCLVG